MKSRAFHISKSLSLQSEHIEKPQILYMVIYYMRLSASDNNQQDISFLPK